MIPLKAATEPKQPQDKVVSPVSGKAAESQQQRSQNVPSQPDKCSSKEDVATESEVESLKLEKGTKPRKGGMWYIIFCPVARCGLESCTTAF